MSVSEGSLTPLVIIITNRKVSPLIIIIITIMLMMIIIIMMMSFKRAFKWASQSANLTKQPTTVLDRLTVGRYLTLIMGAMDAEWREDYSKLLFILIR